MVSLAEKITRMAGGDWHGDYGNTPGPGHNDFDRSVSVKDHPDDPNDVIVKSFANDDWRDIKDDWRRKGWLPEQGTNRNATLEQDIPPHLKNWNNGLPVKDTVAEIYITGTREININSFHDMLFGRLFNAETKEYHPALMFAMRPFHNGPNTAIQRVFLDENGRKLEGVEAKKSQGQAKGAAFWVGDFENKETVCICEGPEDALAIHAGTNFPVMASMSASNMPNIQLPVGVNQLIVCADHGSAGEAAAQKTKNKHKDKVEVLIARTPNETEDWNDLYIRDELAVAACIAQANQTDELIGDQIITLSAAEIKPKPIDWMWPSYIAQGKISLLAGEPGTGKSQTCLNITATVTNGDLWPCGSKYPEPANVLILSAEDDPEDTIVPRLMAAGADLSRVEFIESVKTIEDHGESKRSFNLEKDVVNLERVIKRWRPRLLIIDPISAYMGKADGNSNNEIRSLLEPFVKLTAEYGVAVITLTHLNKSNNTNSPINRILGSIGLPALARAGFAVVKDRDDEAKRLFLPIKNNIGEDRMGWSYRIKKVILPDGIETSKIVWDSEPVSIKAVEAMNPEAGDERSAIEEAMEFLEVILDGKDLLIRAKEVIAEATASGISERTLKRAKKRLRVKSQKISNEWWWHLPLADEQGQRSQGVHTCTEAPLSQKQTQNGQYSLENSQFCEGGHPSSSTNRGLLENDAANGHSAEEYLRAKWGDA